MGEYGLGKAVIEKTFEAGELEIGIVQEIAAGETGVQLGGLDFPDVAGFQKIELGIGGAVFAWIEIRDELDAGTEAAGADIDKRMVGQQAVPDEKVALQIA